MATKKKTTPVKQFIAFDDNTDTIIGIGSLADIKEMIECYADEEGFNEGDVDALIVVYELGPVKKINAYPKGLEIFFQD
jgi:hypothetical protein